MTCNCCGSVRLDGGPVLWKELTAEWRLGPDEAAYVDRQQGWHCLDCGANLRSMALAGAVMRFANFAGLFRDFVRGPGAALRVLEINEACHLTPYLCEIPGHELRRYPDVDMMDLPMPDATYDLVVHSDTLEHVLRPVRGLSECRRVLRPGGACAFTVPMIVGRLTVSREGLSPSYHGNPSNPADCRVYTEYGADAWADVIRAGFPECRIFSLEYPAAQALVGVN
jgi:SAM-dependent methyltransferase